MNHINLDAHSTIGHLATLAGGCFWCLEPIFLKLQGVIQVTSGYAGGQTINPTYEDVCSGTTGHAECIQLSYTPDQVTYQTLLEIFFTYHDPTTPNRQGNDVGTQYRSVIFTHDQTQSKTAHRTIKSLDYSSNFDNPIVTEVSKLEVFHKAEDCHQQYFRSNPSNSYCNAVINPKLVKLRKKHAHLLKPQ
jgi:peptide-methionine (S)-S-oxide reductase